MASGAARPGKPGPRAHLQGQLALADRVAELAGGHPQWARFRELLDRPEALPERGDGLKYDAYLSEGRGGLAWGVTLNDRWEQATFPTSLERLMADWGLGPPPLPALRAALTAAPTLTVSAGFDSADRSARLKLYLQEDRWGEGLAEAGAVDDALGAALGLRLPPWVPPCRRVPVISLQWRDGLPSARVYLGGATPEEAGAGAPDEARALLRELGRCCPGPGWYYLTARIAAGEPVRVAANKVYSADEVGFGDAAVRQATWRELGALFRRAGRQATFARVRTLRRELAAQRVHVVPTASALEDGCRSADCYLAAWAL